MADRRLPGEELPDLENGPTDDGGDEGASKQQTGKLIDLISKSKDVDVYRDPDGVLYMDAQVRGHRETYPLNAEAARLWVARLFYAELGGSSRSAIDAALDALKAKAQFDGDVHRVGLRVARGDDGAIYLDLGNDDWSVVRIAEDWEVLRKSSMRFRRPQGMLPLPMPVRGGSVEELYDFVNLESDDDFRLAVQFLVGALQPDRPFPVAALHGEQGSGKSTFARILRNLIDPNKAAIRSAPRNEADLVVACNAGHMIALDNLSRIQPWLSDALCRVTTGGGSGKRKLYADLDEVIIAFRRPVILNGIADVVTRPDLTDRSLFINLPPIPEERRVSEAEFWERFEVARPRILGALLDAACAAWRGVSHVQLDSAPRMADFATWCYAAAKALPWSPEESLDAYLKNRRGATEAVLELDSVAQAVRGLLEERTEYQGNYQRLLDLLVDHAGADHLKRLDDWPNSARSLSAALRRIAPNLRDAGYEVVFDRTSGRGSAKSRVLRLRAPEPHPPEGGEVAAQPSPPSPPSPLSGSEGKSATYETESGDGPETQPSPSDGNRPHPDLPGTVGGRSGTVGDGCPDGVSPRNSSVGDGGDGGDGLERTPVVEGEL